eukprot:6363627-Heterocapsa_arctica.AAC.1
MSSFRSPTQGTSRGTPSFSPQVADVIRDIVGGRRCRSRHSRRSTQRLSKASRPLRHSGGQIDWPLFR